MSAIYHITLQAFTNADLRQSFKLTDSAGQPRPLAGADLRMGIATAAGVAALVATTANGRILVADAPAGIFEIAVAASDLATLSPGVYRHDLVLSDAAGTTMIWNGTLNLARGIAQ